MPRELFDAGEIRVGQNVRVRATAARIFPKS